MSEENITNIDRLSNLMYKNTNESKFYMMRNMSYGASGINLVIILLLVQVWNNSIELKISLYSSCISMPLMLCSGIIYEFYILSGKRSYEHYRDPLSKGIFSSLLLSGGISLLTSICAIVYFLDSSALWALGGSIIASFLIVSVFNHSLANKVFSENNSKNSNNANKQGRGGSPAKKVSE